MLSFKGILKNAIYVFIAGWMFFLGILVGRGSAPVTFETDGFQKRLAEIVLALGKAEPPEEKVELQFYDALNNPVQQEVVGRKNDVHEISPKKETSVSAVDTPLTIKIPVKTSRKAATFNKDVVNNNPAGGDDPPVPKAVAKPDEKIAAKKPRVSVEKKGQTSSPEPGAEKKIPALEDPAKKTGEPPQNGAYTIQVASYKSFTDAVTHMAVLEKKGISSYRALGKKDGITWYRVRVGSFETWKEAIVYADKLKQAQIEGLVVKKE